MIWVVVIAAVALAGMIVLALYAVSLAHKVDDVKNEVGVVTVRAQEIAQLVGQVRLPTLNRD